MRHIRRFSCHNLPIFDAHVSHSDSFKFDTSLFSCSFAQHLVGLGPTRALSNGSRARASSRVAVLDRAQETFNHLVLNNAPEEAIVEAEADVAEAKVGVAETQSDYRNLHRGEAAMQWINNLLNAEMSEDAATKMHTYVVQGEPLYATDRENAGEKYHLFVREDQQAVWEYVVETWQQEPGRYNFAIMGDAGIGKSRSIEWAMLQFVRQETPPPAIVVWSEWAQLGHIFRVEKDRPVRAAWFSTLGEVWDLHDSRTVLFHDCASRPHLLGRPASTIAVCAAQNDMLRQFVKYKSTVKVLVDPFTAAELVVAGNSLGMDESSVLQAFKQCGGVPRYVLNGEHALSHHEQDLVHEISIFSGMTGEQCVHSVKRLQYLAKVAPFTEQPTTVFSMEKVVDKTLCDADRIREWRRNGSPKQVGFASHASALLLHKVLGEHWEPFLDICNEQGLRHLAEYYDSCRSEKGLRHLEEYYDSCRLEE